MAGMGQKEEKSLNRREIAQALAGLRKRIKRKDLLDVFREVFGRDPVDDNELDEYAEEYVRELYNRGQ